MPRGKDKVKRKIKHLTPIMPVLEWSEHNNKTYIFRMPLNFDKQSLKDLGIGVMKELQLHTPTKNRKKKVWANIYQQFTELPSEIYMKDIKFGFIPYHQRDKHRIIWIDEEINIPINDVKCLTLKGTAISYSDWTKTYNPYIKYNKYLVDKIRNNRRLQMSLPNLIAKYKDSGKWEEIRSTIKSIWDITTSNTLANMGNILRPTLTDFIIPNPIKSVRISIRADSIVKPHFNFVLNQGTTNKHQLENHISSAPKSFVDKYYNTKEFDEAYEKYVDEGMEGSIHTLRSNPRNFMEWDQDPVLIEEDNPFTRSDGTIQEEGDPF